ncbi:hypothetical protein FCJ61_35485 [Burkholderia metallica]|nr:hypothetical protein [Burkholderia metallica]
MRLPTRNGTGCRRYASLSADWARRYQQISKSEVRNGHAQSAIRRGRPAKEADPAIHESTSSQMSLL